MKPAQFVHFLVAVLAGTVTAAPLAGTNSESSTSAAKRQILPPFKEQFFEDPPKEKRQILPPFKEQFFEEPPKEKRQILPPFKEQFFEEPPKDAY